MITDGLYRNNVGGVDAGIVEPPLPPSPQSASNRGAIYRGEFEYEGSTCTCRLPMAFRVVSEESVVCRSSGCAEHFFPER